MRDIGMHRLLQCGRKITQISLLTWVDSYWSSNLGPDRPVREYDSSVIILVGILVDILVSILMGTLVGILVGILMGILVGILVGISVGISLLAFQWTS